jgi:hypothetical protein
MILNYDPSDCLTPEQEAEIDAAYAEEQVELWLAEWSADFHSDEWAAAAEQVAL